MSIKEILVYVDNDDACVDRLRFSVSLCSEFTSNLAGIYVQRKLIAPYFIGAHIPTNIMEAGQKESTRLLENASAVFAKETDVYGVAGEFTVANNGLFDAVSVRSRYSDLLIVPQTPAEEWGLNPYFSLSDLLLGAASPVLMLPSQADCTAQLQRAVVAWDGSRECARALRSARPLLDSVESLHVVTVGQDEALGREVESYLQKCGFRPILHNASGDGSSVGEVLLDHATACDADLLVMGAYGHSRIREWVLGGATEHVISNATLPVVFSH